MHEDDRCLSEDLGLSGSDVISTPAPTDRPGVTLPPLFVARSERLVAPSKWGYAIRDARFVG